MFGILTILLKKIHNPPSAHSINIFFVFRKDVNGFFAFPVTDAIAPGYSSIIQYAMDFSTLYQRIENDEFRGVMDFKVRDGMTFLFNNANQIKSEETCCCGLCLPVSSQGSVYASSERQDSTYHSLC